MFCLATQLCLVGVTILSPKADPPSPSVLPHETREPMVAVSSSRSVPVQETSQDAAHGSLVTDRPDATESSETIPAGLIQLETGYTFASAEHADDHSLGEILVRIGLSRNLELRAGFNSYVWVRGSGGNATGFSDTSIGLKWRLANAGPPGSGRLGLAVIAATSLPTGADALSDGAAQPHLVLTAALDPTDRVALGANFGWAYRNDPELQERFSELLGTFAVGIALSERWGAYAEVFGAYGLGGPAADSFVNGGLTYLVSNDLQLDGRLGYGLSGQPDSVFAGLGAAFRW